MGTDSFELTTAAAKYRVITAMRSACLAVMSEFPASPHTSQPGQLRINVTLVCDRHAIEADGAELPIERRDA